MTTITTAANTAHQPGWRWDAYGHGYPYRPTCSCGWEHAVGYVSELAALLMSEAHVREATLPAGQRACACGWEHPAGLAGVPA